MIFYNYIKIQGMIPIDNQYRTIENYGTAETVEKRSRFIAHVRPVSSETEALEYLNSLKQKYWDARHNVYAYIIRENNIVRYSDDGEPGGTAGLPVLEILKREGLSDIIVVVTRYFGGILLGTGGLVHAYSKAAKAGVEAAGIVDMILCRLIKIKCDYNLIGKVQYEINAFGDAFSGEVQYDEAVIQSVYVPTEKSDMFINKITDKTNARVEIELGETVWFEKK